MHFGLSRIVFAQVVEAYRARSSGIENVGKQLRYIDNEPQSRRHYERHDYERYHAAHNLFAVAGIFLGFDAGDYESDKVYQRKHSGENYSDVGPEAVGGTFLYDGKRFPYHEPEQRREANKEQNYFKKSFHYRLPPSVLRVSLAYCLSICAVKK